jgi:hypothetical protein
MWVAYGRLALTTSPTVARTRAWLAAFRGTVLPQHTAIHAPGVEQGCKILAGVMRVWVAAGLVLQRVSFGRCAACLMCCD